MLPPTCSLRSMRVRVRVRVRVCARVWVPVPVPALEHVHVPVLVLVHVPVLVLVSAPVTMTALMPTCLCALSLASSVLPPLGHAQQWCYQQLLQPNATQVSPRPPAIGKTWHVSRCHIQCSSRKAGSSKEGSSKEGSRAQNASNGTWRGRRSTNCQRAHGAGCGAGPRPDGRR